MANNERIIDLRDKLIKGYEEEIELLKQQNALLRENREKIFISLRIIRKLTNFSKKKCITE